MKNLLKENYKRLCAKVNFRPPVIKLCAKFLKTHLKIDLVDL